MVLISVLVGTAIIGGGGYFAQRFLRNRIADSAEGVKNDIKAITLPVVHVVLVFLLMATIWYCDAFLRAGSHATFEVLLTNFVYYSCWLGILYLSLKILFDDVFGCGTTMECLIVVMVMIIGAYLLYWWIFGDHIEQS